MSLSAGTRLGPYEILAELGAGGMGEVYRAKDTKLDREVAVKVLPEALAQDPDRLARFEREAKVLASLNHPNIAQIYGIENRALIMELVPGETLKGPLPLATALNYAKQIAEALEAAHDKGITHRDLKPGNIMVTPAGVVKVLDFGLAAVGQSADGSKADPSKSPTLTMRETKAGFIMGTAAYMSPEQASGKPVDKRADIWSFGVVLYEMLTGHRLFDGETISHTLADVLRGPIDLAKLPAETPRAIRDLLRRCLNRDLKMRLRDIGDARIALGEPMEEAPSQSPAGRVRRSWLPWVIAALSLLVLTPVNILHLREQPPPPPPIVRFTIPLPEKGAFGGYLSLSPDGRTLAFVFSSEGSTRLWIRPLDSLQSHPLAGTEGTQGVPFWSFDSRYLVFWTGGKLKKIDVSGGPPQTLCDMPFYNMRGFWTRDNRIVFGTANGVFQVAAGGGTAILLTTRDASRGEIYNGVPALLPDGRHFVFQRFAPGSVETGGIYLASLDTKPEAQGFRRLLPDQSMPAYVPSSDPAAPNNGHLLFVREGTLMAQPFDAARLELSGEAIPIVGQISSFGAYSVSETGTLAYAAGLTDRRLTWYDRQGRASGTAWTPGQYFELNLSHDGRRIAATVASTASRLTNDIWVFEFARGVGTRLTNGPGRSSRPVWSPDGVRIAYEADAAGAYEMRVKSTSAPGGGELLHRSSNWFNPADWSADGRFILFEERESDRDHIWFMPMDSGRTPTRYLQTEFNETEAQFSPDGRFVAYVSDQSGTDQVYVSSFPDPNAVRVAISHASGFQPRWRRDGKELLYLSGDGTLMSVDVTLSPTFKAGTPSALFQVPIYKPAGSLRGRRFWDLTPDGQRFLVNISGDASSPLTVVLNWHPGLRK